MRVLLSAFACAPGRGSEPGVAWGFIQKAAARHEVWVLTNARNRPLIEAESPNGSMQSVNYVYIAPPVFKTLAYRSPWRHYLYYMAWQIEALRVAKRLHREVGFDIVHHLTYMNPWIPSLLGWVGPDFVWTSGYIGKTPWRFIREMSRRGKIDEIIRNIALSIGFSFAGPLTARRAALVLSASPPGHWAESLPVLHFPLGGLTEADLALIPKAEIADRAPFRVVSIGRMLPWKGYDLGLKAFAKFHRVYPKSEYWLIGAGPELSRLEDLAHNLGISNATKFFGQMPRGEVFDHLAQASVLLHPSLRESFGYVVVEALAAGVPVICLDVGGPSGIVQGGVGIKVKPQDPKQVVRALGEALYELASDPERRSVMSQLAYDHARRYWTWDAVGDSLLDLYQSLKEEGSPGHG